jgi:hypothetical protein
VRSVAVTVSAKARNVVTRSNTGIMDWSDTPGKDVYLRLFYARNTLTIIEELFGSIVFYTVRVV